MGNEPDVSAKKNKTKQKTPSEISLEGLHSDSSKYQIWEEESQERISSNLEACREKTNSRGDEKYSRENVFVVQRLVWLEHQENLDQIIQIIYTTFSQIQIRSFIRKSNVHNRAFLAAWQKALAEQKEFRCIW